VRLVFRVPRDSIDRTGDSHEQQGISIRRHHGRGGSRGGTRARRLRQFREVLMTEDVSVEGFAVTEEVKVWLASSVGPVKAEVLTNGAGAEHVTITEELESFKKA
jgi:hypothetical protein